MKNEILFIIYNGRGLACTRENLLVCTRGRLAEVSRMYTRTSLQLHANGFLVLKSKEKKRAACAESASSGRWRKQAGYKAMLATTRVSVASVCCLLSFGL